MADPADPPWSRSGDRRFASTRWSVVLAAARSQSEDGRAALETLCQLYWYPVYAYVRRRGRSLADAQDLTQEFFAALLDKHYLESVDPHRGRFRSFLLTAVDRFLLKQYNRERAIKRGGGARMLSIDATSGEQRYQLQSAGDKTPEQLFERQWALTLLEQSLKRLHERYVRDGNAENFEQLKPLLIPAADPPSYAELGARLGMTEGAVKMSVLRMRQRYREALHEEIAATLDAGDDLTDELHKLLAALKA